MSSSTLLARLTLILSLLGAGSAAAEVTPELAASLRPTIEEGLASTDANVQAIAVRAAPSLGDDDLTAVVVEQLANANASVRIAAATALLLAGEAERDARAALVAEFVNGDAAVRATLLERALPVLPPEEQAQVLNGALDGLTSPDTFRQVVAWIAQRGQGAAYAVLDRIESVTPELRTIMVEEICRAGREEGLAFAQTLIGARDASLHGAGAEIAFALNTVEARSALEGLLGDEDAALAQRVGFFLAPYGSMPALERVRDLALNPEMPEDLRIQAIAIVRDTAPTLATLEQLQAAAGEAGRSTDFVLTVHQWIGATRTAEAVAYLEGLRNGLFGDDRLKAFAGLGFLGESAPIDDFIGVLQGGAEPAQRVAAARALGHAGSAAAVQVLSQQLFAERDEALKLAIIEALGDAGDASAAEQITYEFAAQNATVTLAALRTLRRLGNTSVSRHIESLVTTAREPEVRWLATVVLTELDPQLGRIRLLQAIDRPPEGFREDIAGFPEELLNEIDEALLVNSDPDVRQEALYRVLTRPDGGYAVLRPLLDGNLNPDIRSMALSVVIARRSLEDAELLVRLTSDPDRGTRLQAMTALAELSDPAQAELFHDQADHADFQLRLMAAYALLNIYTNNAITPPVAPPEPAAEEGSGTAAP